MISQRVLLAFDDCDVNYMPSHDTLLQALCAVVEAAESMVERYTVSTAINPNSSDLRKGLTVGNHYILRKALDELEQRLREVGA
jgi:hypothetical protein